MSPRRNYQQPLQEEEIEDLLQELARLKLRLSRIERRENLSSLGRDRNVARGKYAATMASRSFVPTKSLRTDGVDEGIADDQISSIPPSIEFNFEEVEDPLPKSSSLPILNEPVYDVYDDDMFNEVLDLEQPAYDDDDESKVDTPLESSIPIIPDKTTNMLTVTDSEIGMTKPDHDNHLGTFIHSDTKSLVAIVVDEDIYIVDQFDVKSNSTLEECHLHELLRLHLMLKSLLDGKNDTGGTYPDRFSQPNPPPYGGQPDIFL